MKLESDLNAFINMKKKLKAHQENNMAATFKNIVNKCVCEIQHWLHQLKNPGVVFCLCLCFVFDIWFFLNKYIYYF